MDNNEVIDFILNKMPLGVLVFDPHLSITYRNRQAENFLKRFTIPEEVEAVNKRIFDVIGTAHLRELFPGDIYISKKLDGSPSTWMFRVQPSEGPSPFVTVFIVEQSVSNNFDLNRIRKNFSLTRRETDILRRVLDGLTNSEMSEDLDISEQTVKDHLSNVYMKFKVKNRFALIRSLISSPEP
ncbi:MAG TPA: helix-turn-helix transcriptional regulator [Thermodesulfovibrionales bacterium]|nr:helix-turn-helix transcriptional regulator [Thermodesulfovibrionales bacterium]